MNSGLLLIAAPLALGIPSLKKLTQELDGLDIYRISSVYRRVDEGTEGTLTSEVMAVLLISTSEELSLLLERLNKLKKQNLGVRCELLTFNHDVRLDPEAPIPHPDLHLDPLVLRCASEIRGEFEHPVLGQSLQELVKSSSSSFGEPRFEFLTRGESLLSPDPEVP